MKTDEQIEIILEDFNFEVVETVMRLIDWKYNGSENSPTVIELRALAKKCLKKSAEEGHYSQGGFEADYVGGILELRFVLERTNPLSYLVGDKKHVNEQAKRVQKRD
jgi:hypothetical protein